MLNFDRSTVKHGTQNIQNDCHQWLSDSFRLHEIRFRSGLRPGPQRSPRGSSWLKGPASKREVEGRKREKGEKKGTGGTGPLSQIPGSAPV